MVWIETRGPRALLCAVYIGRHSVYNGEHVTPLSSKGAPVTCEAYRHLCLQ